MTTAQTLTSQSWIRCTDPATGELLGEVPAMSRAEVLSRIQRAKQAQVAWGKTSFAERRRVLSDLLEYTVAQADELAESACRDAGKTKENAMLGEIWPVAEKLRWTINEGEKHLRPERVSSGLLVHKRATIEFHPLGVVGIISPWNFPFQNILGPTISALFAGNAALIKVSEWSSWSAGRVQRMFDEVLNARGHSTDLVQILTGYGETGAALVSGGVDLVVFTGSIKNGRRVIEESAKALVPVILELGGKDPMIVCDDAHLEQAAHTALTGCFLTAGQMCLATERIYVFDSVHDAFVEEVLKVARTLRPGVDVGSMTMPGQLDIVQRLVDDAVAKGAVVKLGGKGSAGKRSAQRAEAGGRALPDRDPQGKRSAQRAERAEAGGRALPDRDPQVGQYFEPTVLTNVDHSMLVMKEETFGPVMAICRVSDEEEAIRMANDSEYGLSSSVFTTDSKRAARMARQIVAGSTCINDFGLAYIAQDLPFGGTRGSGFGRLNGRDGLRACTNQKAYLEDRIPIHAPKKVFPVSEGDYELARSAIKLIYGGWKERARGARDVVRTLSSRARSEAGPPAVARVARGALRLLRRRS